MREKLTVNVVDELIASLDLSSEVISVTYDAETDRSFVSVCNSYHIRERMNITFSYENEPDAAFDVLNWDRADKDFLPYDSANNTFYVYGNVAEIEEPEQITLPPLHYFHSTPTAFSTRITNVREGENKFPAFYLRQVFTERRLGANNGVRREAELLCYLLDSQALEEFNTDQRYISRIEGLKKTYDLIEKEIRTSPLFVNYDEVFRDVERPKFGIFSSNKGHNPGLTNTRCDAIEIQFTLRMKPSCLTCPEGCEQC